MQTEGTFPTLSGCQPLMPFSSLLALRREISDFRLPKCSSILSSISECLSRICLKEWRSSPASILPLVKREQFLLGDGWHWKDELEVLASLALCLDIKCGFPIRFIHVTEQKKDVRPPLPRTRTTEFYKTVFFLTNDNAIKWLKH